jgi:hypothetical protein
MSKSIFHRVVRARLSLLNAEQFLDFPLPQPELAAHSPCFCSIVVIEYIFVKGLYQNNRSAGPRRLKIIDQGMGTICRDLR